MKKLYFLAIMISLHAIANSQTTFQRLYSGSAAISFSQTIQTSDGGYITCGSVGAASTDYLVSKLDASGQIQWAKHIGSWMGNENALKIGESVTGGYYLLGITTSQASNGDLNLISLDISGNVLWNKIYSNDATSSFISASCRQTNSGEFIISATLFNGTGDYYFLIKTDVSGNKIWSEAYSYDTSGSKQECLDVECCSDGGFISIGTANDNGIYAIKTDASGNLLWEKQYSTPVCTINASTICKTSDGCYLISGVAYDSLYSQSILFTKIDASGNFLWAKKYISPTRSFYLYLYNNSNNVIQTPDGGFAILISSLASGGSSATDPELVKINSSGKPQWAKYYTLSGSFGQGASSVKNTNDGGFINTANTTDSMYTNQHGYLIKTNSTGSTGCNEGDDSLYDASITLTAASIGSQFAAGTSGTISFISESIPFNASSNCSTDVGIFDPTETNTDVSIYPNPFSASANLLINTNNYSPEEYHFELYDMLGKKVKENLFSGLQLEINRENIPAGIYVWKVYQKSNMVGKGKLVIE
ncbi:MAG: T9SS type A sorting domain-containing protein [Bacteroidia bacterium]